LLASGSGSPYLPQFYRRRKRPTVQLPVVLSSNKFPSDPCSHISLQFLEDSDSLQSSSLFAVHQRSIMTSAPLFSTLPPELICQVFEFAADFLVVAALAQTSRPLYHTWRRFPSSICRAVDHHALFSLADAELLLDVHEEAAEATDQLQDRLEPKSIVRAKRLFFNTRCASAVTKEWIGLLEIEYYFDRENDPIRPSEIVRFQHAFYCVWTIAVMETSPHLQHKASTYLDKCSPRELCRLDELVT
jgi:hypothetical protein